MPSRRYTSKPPLGTPIDRAHPRAHGLIGAWDLLEGGGTVAHDSTRTYGDGAILNGAIRKNLQGGGNQLDLTGSSSNQKLYIPYNANYPFCKGSSPTRGLFTLGMLVRPANTSGLTVGLWDDVISGSILFNSFISNNVWQLSISGGGNSNLATLTPGSLVYLVHVFDDAASTCKSFINGVLVSSVNTDISGQGPTGRPEVTGDIHVGGSSSGFTLPGQIGLVRLWNYPLSDTQVSAEYLNPWAIYRLPGRKALSEPGVFPQTVDPDSISSAESWGGPTLKETQTLDPDSISSAEAWGGPLLSAPQTTEPGSIPSTESWGDVNVAGPVNPDSIPSAESWGSPTINAQQSVDAGTIASGESWGSPRVANVKTLRPDSIPSAESWGSPKLTGVLRPIIAGSILSGESWGAPTIIGGLESLQIFVGGYDRTRWLKRGTATMQSQSLGRWTGECTFLNTPSGDPRLVDTVLDWTPLRGQTVLIKEFGDTIFRGCIKNEKISRELDTDLLLTDCILGDKSSICDRRVIRKSYPDVSQGLQQWDIADVIRDIVANFLDGEGITLDPALPDSLGDLTSPLSPFITVTQAFDNIYNMSGLNWFIDKNQTLFFLDSGDAAAAPFSVTETSRNWRSLVATISDDDYRNRQFVVSNSKIIPADNGGVGGVPSKTESYTMIDSGTGDPVIPDHTGLQNLTTPPGYVYVNFSISSVVSIKVNGAAKTVYAMEDLTSDILFGADQSWWTFFRSGAANTSFIEGRSYPAPGDVIEVEYIPPSDAAAAGVSTDDVLSIEAPFDPPLGEQFGTCGSGRYDAVEQVNDINTAEGIESVAAGLLDRSGVIPKQVDFETDVPGLQVGQLLQVNVPRQQLNDGAGPLGMFITQLNGASNPDGEDLGHRSSFRWQVTAMNLPDVGNWIKTWERLWRRTQHPVPIDRPVAATIVLGQGAPLLAGAVLNPYPLVETGQLAEVVGIFASPPQDQDLVLDLLINGVSILDSAKFVVPAGTTTLVSLTTFANVAVWLRKNDILTVRVSYRITGPNPVAARSGVVSLRTLA